MASAVGCADIEAYSRAGLSLGLGTDGFSSDLFLGMRTASLLSAATTPETPSGAGVASDLLFRLTFPGEPLLRRGAGRFKAGRGSGHHRL